MSCLDDNTLLAFAERALSEPELASVSEHLDRCEACLTIACAVARSAATPEGEPPAPARETIGRYALIEMIGRGGMGQVYLAHDPQLDRQVALKVVRAAQVSGPELRARLSREARAMAKVVHPHVVTVFDAGELDDGVFIAMELVAGDTLTRWLARAPRTWRDVVRVFLRVGQGLAAAHAAGLVHRDFKPDNVLVDPAGRPAVTDFGLALADAAPPLESALAALPLTDARTRTAGLVGTPLYMSPEQFASAPVDARSDQFSFAVALYEALYAQRPFAGTTLGDLRDSVAAGELRPRPAHTLVPARVHRVLVRALATRPAARFPAMTDLLGALEAALRPRWRPVAVGGALLVAAVAAWLVVRALDAPAPPPPPTAGATPPAAAPAPPAARDDATPPARTVVFVAPFANTSGDPRLDDTLDVTLESALYRSTRLDPVAGVELADALTRRSAGSGALSPDELAAQATAAGRATIVVSGAVAPAGDGGLVVSLRARGGAGVPVQLTAERRVSGPAAALAAAGQLGAVLRIALGDPPALGSLDHLLSPSLDAVHAWAKAQALAAAGQNDASARECERAIAADPAFVEAHATLGGTLYNAGKSGEAARELEIAARDSDHMAERARLSALGDYYGAAGRYADAIAAYEQSLAKWPGDIRTEINITSAAIDGQSWPLALDLARRAAHAHGTFAVARGNLLLAEVANGKLDDAIRDGDAMLVDIAHPTAFGLTFLALAHALRGEPDAARATYDRLAATEPELADGGRADLLVFEGRPEDAEALLRRRIADATRRGAPATAATEQLLLARLRLAQGDRAGAARAALAAQGEDSPRWEYEVRRLLIAAGAPGDAATRARAWRDRDSADWRAAGELLAGDLALAAGAHADAIAADQRAGRIARSWLQRERLGVAYLAAGAWSDAERELAWCHDHRGEAAVYMTPSLALLPEAEASLAAARRRGE